MSNYHLPLINPLSGKVISKNILDFSSLDTLIDYLYSQEPSFQKQGSKNKDWDYFDFRDDPFSSTCILIINQNGELLTSSLFSQLKNSRNMKFFIFNKNIFFSKNDNINTDDYLNHTVDPLPTLIKPVKPSLNSKVLLASWAIALEMDVQSYFSIIQNFHDREYDLYKESLRSLTNFITKYCRSVFINEDEITNDTLSTYDYDLHQVKTNFKNILIDETFSLLELLDVPSFEQYYFKFKDLKQKVSTFKQNIIFSEYEKLTTMLTNFEYFITQLLHKFDDGFDKKLDFDIDALMYDKFITLIHPTSGNLLTSQIDNLYTIANSLFVKSTEIMIMKRTIQKEMVGIEYGGMLRKMMDLKKNLEVDYDENKEVLKERFDKLKFIEYDLPLMYGMSLLEGVRRKIIFKTKYYIKFSSLIVNENDWLEEDLKVEYEIRSNYLRNLEPLENVSFLNKKVFNNKFQIKNTFSDLKKLQKYITLGEYDDGDPGDEELDVESRNFLSYCDYLEHNNYENLSSELIASFEDMKSELLNSSENLHQLNTSKIDTLENEIEDLKTKLILQDLIEIDDWPVEMSTQTIKNYEPTTTSTNTTTEDYETLKYEENKTIKLLNEQLRTSTEKNVFMENKLNEMVLTFKQDFSVASRMNSELIKENEDMKAKVKQLEDENKNMHDRMKNLIYKDISLLEKIGLLLDIKNMQINRVKGLKSQQSNMMSSTILLPKNEELILKADIDKLNGFENTSDMLVFEDNFRELFNDSIVKRFGDVEELAKKYTKENKQLKKHIKHLEDSV